MNSAMFLQLDSYGMLASDIFSNIGILLFTMTNRLTLCIFKAKVKQKVQTEFQIAKLSGKLEKFQRDWTHNNLLTEIRNGVLVLNF